MMTRFTNGQQRTQFRGVRAGVVSATMFVAAVALPAQDTFDAIAAAVETSLRDGAREAPALVEVLGLQPGMVFGDVGAGFGGWAFGVARLLREGSTVYATDIGTVQLTRMRDIQARDGVTNVRVIEGALESTNLPDNCCDAVLMRNVYHHLPSPEPVVASVFAALKPGGRFAIIDFPARAGSPLPAGVRKNRGGNGIPASVVLDEMKASAFTYVRTITAWPPDSQRPAYFLVLFEKPRR